MRSNGQLAETRIADGDGVKTRLGRSGSERTLGHSLLALAALVLAGLAEDATAAGAVRLWSVQEGREGKGGREEEKKGMREGGDSKRLQPHMEAAWASGTLYKCTRVPMYTTLMFLSQSIP